MRTGTSGVLLAVVDASCMTSSASKSADLPSYMKAALFVKFSSLSGKLGYVLSWDSRERAVDTVIRLRAGKRGSIVRFWARTRDIFHLQIVQTAYGGPPDFLTTGYRRLFTRR